MGRINLDYIQGNNLYCCAACASHLTCYNNLISKAFKGRTGKAYLFTNVMNITLGPVEERLLLTGLHKVCDIFCKLCHSELGWKYEYASEPTQKYKEGKFILEKALIKKDFWTI